MISLDELIQKVYNKNSILFVGAGFSFNAQNIHRKSFLMAKDLSEKLDKLSGSDSEGNLANAVDEYLETRGEHSLISLLKEEYTAFEVSEEHKVITSLPWKRVYTTNYDDVIEKASLINKKLMTPITLNDKPFNFKDKHQLCIHLNGYIDRLTPDTLKNEFKLSDVSYLTTDFKNSEWVSLFRNDIKTSDAIFFVGFSLIYDLDLKRILFDQPETHEKTSFILYDRESQINLKNAAKFGEVHPIGLSAFSNKIQKIKIDFIPPEHTNIIYQSFKNVQNFDDIKEIKDIDAIELFYEGNIKQEFIQLSISDPLTYKYFIKRDKLDDVLKEIKKGSKNILVHSDLGNGKTIFLNGLSYLLKGEGHNIFIFNKDYETTENEIENICTREIKPVIIIESYANHLNTLEQIRLYRTKDVVVILSERSLINDTTYSKLEDDIFKEQYVTYDLNSLSNNEVDQLVKLFDSYGFWGSYSSLKDIQKEKLITTDCKRSLRLLLLKILNSPDIQNRFSKILNTIQKKGNFYNAIIIVLVSNIFDFQLELDDLIYILDDELLNNPSFINNTNLKEIINFNTRKINVRSSVLSEAILNNLDNKRVIIDCLIMVVSKLDKRRFDRNSYITIKNIVSFSRMQKIVDQRSRDYKANIIYFFEQVKNLSSNRQNPYFWLQYAIARLSVRDYDNADIYFKTAYSFADAKKGFDTFQIDNHYARYILENEIYYGTQETCMPQFLKAHKILYNSKNQKDARHYPIRVAKNYIPFFQHYFKGMNSGDQKIFITCCQEMLYRIEEYISSIESRSPTREILECQQGLSDIVNKLIAKL